MKKIIALSSVTLMAGFIVAIANAADSSMDSTKIDSSTTTTQQQPSDSSLSGSSDSSLGQSQVNQQPGTAADSSMSNPSVPSDSSKSMNDTSNTSGTTLGSTTSQTSTKISSNKTCTDDNGKTYRRGDKEFKSCWKKMHKNSDQMSGTVGSSSDRNGEMSGSDVHGNSIDSSNSTVTPEKNPNNDHYGSQMNQ